MNDNEQEVEAPSIFVVILVIGAITAVAFLVAASFALFLTWLIGFATPLPFWQVLTLNAGMLLASVYLIGSRQLVLSLAIPLVILAASAGASVITVIAAWLFARIAPLTIEQALLPAGILTITAIMFLLHAADDIMFELQHEELLEEEEVLLSRLRSESPPTRKSRKRRSKR